MNKTIMMRIVIKMFRFGLEYGIITIKTLIRKEARLKVNLLPKRSYTYPIKIEKKT